MKLSRNFTLSEMVKSPSAVRWGFDEQFNPPQDIINTSITNANTVSLL